MTQRAPSVSATELARLLGLPEPTDEQAVVIEAPLSPALVVAGAGSGKTETMAARVVFLVANGLVRPDQILGLTFTRKAAAQLAQRVRRRLRALASSGLTLPGRPVGPSDADGGMSGPGRSTAEAAAEPTVSTYHAFGGRLIAEYGALAGVETGATVLTPTAAWQLARRVVARWDGDLDADLSPDAVTERLLAISGALADHLVGPADLERELDRILLALQTAPPSPRQRSPLHSGLAQPVKTLRDRRWILPLVRAFRAAKQERGVIDFADQMQLAARLVDDHGGIGESLRDRFRVVLLDEYQDTGHAQRVLLRSVFGAGALPSAARADPVSAGPPTPGHPVTAVGDPVQSIYSWRGASASNLPAFGRDFPLSNGEPAPTFTLLTSFRNPTSVLTVANVASAPIRSGGSSAAQVGELRPAPNAPTGRVAHALFRTVAEEDTWVAETIAQYWRQAGALSTVQRPRPEAGDAPPGEDHSATVGELGPPESLDPVGRADASDPRIPGAVSAPVVVVAGNDGSAVGREPPSTAVLVRRRADMAAMAAALRQQGLPVEVVGLGGLIDEPEVADLIAVLRVLVDPTAGTAALRLLTGSRWRIGTADLEALHRRARSLASRPDAPDDDGRPAVSAVRSALDELAGGEDIDVASLVDALADLGEPEQYSPDGHRRMTRWGAELDRLRSRMHQPLTDLVADVERTIGLEVEVQLSGGAGRAHLDAFAQVVADVAATGAGALELLEYIDAAAEREDGLAPGEVPAPGGQVQVLTVHAAKGLEWEIVAVPHLTAGVFPSGRGGTWFGEPSQLPPTLRGDRADLPSFDLPAAADQKELADRLAAHVEAFREFRLTEERRLLYVAVTRAERVLLISGHHWGVGTSKPAGPSPFLLELAPIAAVHGDPDRWDAPPPEGDAAARPPRSAVWPQDPLGQRRAAVAAGAELVLAALRARTDETAPAAGVDTSSRDGRAEVESSLDDDLDEPDPSCPDPYGWARDVRTLLTERAARLRPRIDVDLPADFSVSGLVDLADDPERVARRLLRPLPTAPSDQARRGQAFHSWVETFYRGEALVGFDELPGAQDQQIGVDDELRRLQDAFRASVWANRIPADIEIPFATRIAGIGVRGRVDALFVDDDGGLTVVDWKTGSPPPAERRAAGDVQLACYRLAVSELTGIPLDRVRAAFHYVAADRTISPRRLLDADGIAAVVAAAVTTDADHGRPEARRDAHSGSQTGAGQTGDATDPAPWSP